MSDDTSTIRIFDADPERVVSVTVGELQNLCTWTYGCGHDFVGMSDATVHERTCHPISAHEAFPNMDLKLFSEQLTKNHAFGIFRFCSVCHSPLGQSDMLDSFCYRCGARVVDDGKEEGGSDD